MTDPGVLSSFHAEQKWDHVRVVKWRLHRKEPQWPRDPAHSRRPTSVKSQDCVSLFGSPPTLRSALSVLLNDVCVGMWALRQRLVNKSAPETKVWIYSCQISRMHSQKSICIWHTVPVNPSTELNKQKSETRAAAFHLCPHREKQQVFGSRYWQEFNFQHLPKLKLSNAILLKLISYSVNSAKITTYANRFK